MRDVPRRGNTDLRQCFVHQRWSLYDDTPQTRQFSATLNRIRWVPENPDKQNTLYSGWLRQRDDKPLKPGFYSFENAKAQTLFEKLLDEIQRSDFYSLHLTPYKGHYVNGPYDGITVGRCGVLTTLTFAPLGTSDTEVPDGDDAHAKRFSTLLDSLENAIYAAPWHFDGPLSKDDTERP